MTLGEMPIFAYAPIWQHRTPFGRELSLPNTPRHLSAQVAPGPTFGALGPRGACRPVLAVLPGVRRVSCREGVRPSMATGTGSEC